MKVEIIKKAYQVPVAGDILLIEVEGQSGLDSYSFMLYEDLYAKEKGLVSLDSGSVFMVSDYDVSYDEIIHKHLDKCKKYSHVISHEIYSGKNEVKLVLNKNT